MIPLSFHLLWLHYWGLPKVRVLILLQSKAKTSLFPWGPKPFSLPFLFHLLPPQTGVHAVLPLWQHICPLFRSIVMILGCRHRCCMGRSQQRLVRRALSMPVSVPPLQSSPLRWSCAQGVHVPSVGLFYGHPMDNMSICSGSWVCTDLFVVSVDNWWSYEYCWSSPLLIMQIELSGL